MENFDFDKFYEFVDNIQKVIAGEQFKYTYFAFCTICYDAYQQGLLPEKILEDFPKMTKEFGAVFYDEN